MHFILSYDLDASGERRDHIENQIEEILSPYRHVKRLNSVYIVGIAVKSEWDTILSKLTKLSQSIIEKFNFIMSPTMSPGRIYNGVLNCGDWDEVNNVSNPQLGED